MESVEQLIAKNAELEAKLADVLVELDATKGELDATKEHLKRYTAPSYKKAYYQRHKDAHKKRVKEYKEKTNYKPTPEQRKVYARTAYLKKKEKLKKENDEKENGENI